MTAARLAAALAVLALLLAGAGPASAQTGTITIALSSTVPGAISDAAPAQVTASGTSPGNALLFVHYRRTGTGNCASRPDDDLATSLPLDGTQLGPGDYTVTATAGDAFAVGTYLVCGWLVNGNDSTELFATSLSTTFTVVAADTLGLSAVADPVEGRPFDVTAAGKAYAPGAVVDATTKPAGGACAATPGADSGAATDGSGQGAGASFSLAVISNHAFDRGGYLVCAWLVDPQNPTQSLRAASATLTVRATRATLQLTAPKTLDAGQGFTITAKANLDWGVPIGAIVTLKPKRAGTACATTPKGEPTSAQQVIAQGVTDTQQPTGDVSASAHTYLSAYGSYIACAWLVAGWTESQTPPVVTGPVSSTMSVVKPQVFHGRTSQKLGLTVTMLTVERFILEVKLADRLRCSGTPMFGSGQRWNGMWNTDLGTSTFGTVHVNGSGHFGMALHGNPAHTFDLHGRLSGTRITGTFTEKGRSYAFTNNSSQNLRCSTGSVHFSIKR